MKQIEVIEEIKKIATLCVNKGWAEGSAGNMSYRIEENMLFNWLIANKEFSLKKTFENDGLELEDNITFLISNGGAKFREIAEDPLTHFSVLYVQNGVLNIHCSDDLSIPSSEYKSHLLIHQYLAKEKPQFNSVIHTHPTYTIAFSHKYSKHSKEKINSILEATMPEIKMFFPQKTGFLEFSPAGSTELAVETLNELKNHEVIIWKKHGILAIGENFWNAIDKIEMLDKAAHIALLAGMK